MAEFPRTSQYPDPQATITTYSLCSFGGSGVVLNNNYGAATFPTSNTAYFVPFRITRPMTFTNMFVINGNVISGNLDVGIYSRDGTRIISKGSTAQTGASAIQNIAVNSTRLESGCYYFALSIDNTTAKVTAISTLAQVGFCSFGGMAQMANAFPLPDTATFGQMTSAFVPLIGLSLRSSV